MGNLIERKKKIMMMQLLSDEIGLKKKIFVPTSDIIYGDTTVTAIKNQLPSSYRYAIAMINDASNLEYSAFVALIILPWTHNVLGSRWRNNQYQVLDNIDNRSYDVIIRSGQKVTILWSEEPIVNELPATSYGSAIFESSATTNAAQVYAEIGNVDDWNFILSVPDIDFTTMPTVNNTYCCSILVDKNNYAGAMGRCRDSKFVTVTGSNVASSAYDMKIASGTKLINFYF